MKRFYLFLLLGILCSLTQLSYGQCSNLVTNFTSDASFTTSTECTINNDLILESNSSDRKIEVNSGGANISVIFNMNNKELSLGGKDSFGNYPSGINLIVDEGDTLTIQGDLYINTNSDLQIDGVLIINGNIKSYDGTFISDFNTNNISIEVGASGMIAVSGSADFGRSSSVNSANIYIGEELDNRSKSGNFSTANVGSDPFGTPSITFQKSSVETSEITIDFFNKEQHMDGVYTEGAESFCSKLLDSLQIDKASGWYGKEIQFLFQGFDRTELDTSNVENVTITSITQLETVIHSVIWKINNADIKAELGKYHRSEKDSLLRSKDMDAEKLSDIYSYFTDSSRTIQVVFVDDNNGHVLDSRHHSNSRMMSVPDVSVNGNSGDLPVALTQFTANATEDNTVLLEWGTASEQNASHFEVQRSVDNKNWETLGQVEAAGNSNVLIYYNFIDESPLPQAYYRLHQVDFDGVAEIFGPIKVNLSNEIGQPFSSKIYPNDIIGDQKVQILVEGLSIGNNLEINVYNKSGHLVLKEASSNLASEAFVKPFDLPSNLPSGMYYVVVKSGKEIARNKIVIR
ncbi:T9SS type A sorting domain-containing protein [Flammeovirga pectinis]|uniref:T9SS type A sorting domain-containing protein n=1 Tax=Flammeovirga pectinis TaxID=2494373 RepID=A0A3S9P5N4_9BACT|nr:T9SS type A sorting domain-containing protein [Flammeovirga pectinis]AZQ63488.1 T9SS type A sorting domain-containing protein [Flammeovirga pectinis]